MGDLTALPKDWKEKASLLPSSEAKRYRHLINGIWIDDDCPSPLPLLVVIGKKIYRITDQALSSKIISI
ncbi:MAG: hypothetical protein Q8P63_00885 [Candidatus Nealsonbacteria bacterium]|nr:hypothetical protein [Candidatus Nealsonbacteria bacterium]